MEANRIDDTEMLKTHLILKIIVLLYNFVLNRVLLMTTMTEGSSKLKPPYQGKHIPKRVKKQNKPRNKSWSGRNNEITKAQEQVPDTTPVLKYRPNQAIV